MQGITKCVTRYANQSAGPAKAMQAFAINKQMNVITQNSSANGFSLKASSIAASQRFLFNQPKMFSSGNKKIVKDQDINPLDADEEINVSPSPKHETVVDLGWKSSIISAEPALDSVIYDQLEEFDQQQKMMARAIQIEEFVETKRLGTDGSPLMAAEEYVPLVEKVFETLETSVNNLAKQNEQDKILMHSLFSSEM